MGLNKENWELLAEENRKQFEEQITWSEEDEQADTKAQLERADKAISEYNESIKKEMYEMRNALVVALAKFVHQSVVYENEIYGKETDPKAVTYACRTQFYPNDGLPVEEGWFLVYIKLESGQVSFHLPIDLWDNLGEIPTVEKNELPINVRLRFDGHTSQDVIKRLLDC